ncbi:MAG TPA: PQQ-binding-like beta-propeller repeat protein, partial [Thermoanaerobaculia bacterium]|nr:PQQ-binding-like beta-propeller repeat protein [Thermoanaerobaculia bacterium]
SPVFVALGSHVLALRPEDGTEVWRTKLRGAVFGPSFLALTLEGGRLYAGLEGQVYCLDPATGEVLWHNKLPGTGRGFICFSGTSGQAAAAAAQAAAAAATGAAVAAGGAS